MSKLKLRHLSVAVSSALLLGFGAHAMADSNKDIVNALVSKGVLTEEEGDLLVKGRTMEQDAQAKKEKKAWTNNIKINGYVQNRVTTMQSGDEGAVLWPDSTGSFGDDRSGSGGGNNFRIRRARIIFSGQVGDHLGFYIQPDFASSAGSGQSNNVAQLRDAYGDIFIDKDKVHRFRVGQSKVPYGYENLQSSSNRLALDRADATNSAVRDERDTGVYYYYTPTNVQNLFKEITDAGLKHTGNYGMLALGGYMGQGANQNDLNDNWHNVARFTYPWKTASGQIFEAGIQAYRGKYVRSTGSYFAEGVTDGNFNATISSNQMAAGTGSTFNPSRLLTDSGYQFSGACSGATTGTVGVGVPASAGSRTGSITCRPGIDQDDRNGFKDERVAVSFRMYPQPWGLEGEWTWGTTPGLDMAENKVKNKSLHGGYIQGSYFAKDVTLFNTNIGNVIPFVKWQYFDGYNKAEVNAPRNKVNDWEIGAEWQIAPEVELVAQYHIMKRTNMTTGGAFNALEGSYRTFDAQALRLQLQYNFF
jgi:phosphate-selective porin/polyhydroxyalkanoate synthesis regulator phasin